MNITPIDSLLHHKVNCNCEKCLRNIKPFRDGKFVSKEELDALQKDLQALVQENEKLTRIIAQYQEKEAAQVQTEIARQKESAQKEYELQRQQY